MADGFFQGGFARGMIASDELGLRERALELDQQSAAQENSRKIRAEALTERARTLDALVKDIGVLKDGGNMSDADINRFANPFVRSIGQIDTLLGRDPSLVAQRIEALIRETPTLTEAAETRGRAAVSQARASAEELGVPVERAATAQGIISPEEKQTATVIAKLQAEHDAAISQGRLDDAAQIQGRINNLTTIVGRTPEDVVATAGARAGATAAAKSQEEGRQEAGRRSLEIAGIGNVLVEAVNLPEGAQGIKGALAETVGGYIGQVNKGLQTKFTEFVTSGATPEELTEFRTQARTAIAQNIETVTGEESGRFTEMERRVTEETIKALQPGASKQQVVSAVSELLKLKVMLRSFSFLKGGIAPRYDLLAQGPALTETATRFVSDMRRFGMNDDQISDLFARLQLMQREVAPVFAE